MVDSLAELDRMTTPYAYAFNDPIRHTDPDGMFGEDVNEDFEEGPGPGPKMVAGITAGGIIGGALAAGGTVALAGTATVVGAPVGWIVGGGIVVGGVIGGGAVYLWDKMHASNNDSPSITPKLKDDAKADAKPGSRAGQPFTPKEKQKVVKANEEKNGRKVVCETCKTETTKPEKSKKE